MAPNEYDSHVLTGIFLFTIMHGQQILHLQTQKKLWSWLKNYISWQTWKEAPIFLIGRIGVDKRLAKETTFDNPRFLLLSCSCGKDMSNEHTLTASLIRLLRFLCNNAINCTHLSQQPRKTETKPFAVKCWKDSNMTIKGAHSLQNMHETADVTFFSQCLKWSTMTKVCERLQFHNSFQQATPYCTHTHCCKVCFV